ncbi:hypothetical protein CVT24_002080 [Panaeolus cyanescens]|uniref:Ig-like domain-containing protein n=1 Tax=Panaeolus cyanescens TaxID=181874 RepID=A0A409W1M3_9AGAR|nr:hypothetical protein CVT24_002080 [Panaeolus cyanescens]
MQFKLFTFFAAALVSASPAMAATAQWFAGADCTGALVGTSNNAQTVSCIWLTNGGSVRSIRYSDTSSIQFFISGGQHDRCANGSQLTRSGSGCATAPDGVNWESISVKFLLCHQHSRMRHFTFTLHINLFRTFGLYYKTLPSQIHVEGLKVLIMQFKLATVIAAALVSASPAMAATAQWFAGADCTGTLIGTSNNAETGTCIWITNGGSARSISYSGTQSIQFYVSGGQHDNCANGSQLTRSGSGCATAPSGFNWQSISVR